MEIEDLVNSVAGEASNIRLKSSEQSLTNAVNQDEMKYGEAIKKISDGIIKYQTEKDTTTAHNELYTTFTSAETDLQNLQTSPYDEKKWSSFLNQLNTNLESQNNKRYSSGYSPASDLQYTKERLRLLGNVQKQHFTAMRDGQYNDSVVGLTLSTKGSTIDEWMNSPLTKQHLNVVTGTKGSYTALKTMRELQKEIIWDQIYNGESTDHITSEIKKSALLPHEKVTLETQFHSYVDGMVARNKKKSLPSEESITVQRSQMMVNNPEAQSYVDKYRYMSTADAHSALNETEDIRRKIGSDTEEQLNTERYITETWLKKRDDLFNKDMYLYLQKQDIINKDKRYIDVYGKINDVKSHVANEITMYSDFKSISVMPEDNKQLFMRYSDFDKYTVLRAHREEIRNVNDINGNTTALLNAGTSTGKERNIPSTERIDELKRRLADAHYKFIKDIDPVLRGFMELTQDDKSLSQTAFTNKYAVYKVMYGVNGKNVPIYFDKDQEVNNIPHSMRDYVAKTTLLNTAAEDQAKMNSMMSFPKDGIKITVDEVKQHFILGDGYVISRSILSNPNLRPRDIDKRLQLYTRQLPLYPNDPATKNRSLIKWRNYTPSSLIAIDHLGDPIRIQNSNAPVIIDVNTLINTR